MTLSAHSDATYLIIIKARSRAGTHNMSEDVLVPSYNGSVLTGAPITKCVMASAAEAKVGGLYVCAKKTAPLWQSLIKMGWSHCCWHHQPDNHPLQDKVNGHTISLALLL